MRIPLLSQAYFWIVTIAGRIWRGLETPVYDLAKKRPIARSLTLATSIAASVITLAFGEHVTALVLAYVSVVLSLLHERVVYLERRDDLLEKLRNFGKRVETHHEYGQYLLYYEIDPVKGGVNDKWIRKFDIVTLDNSSVVVVRRFFVGADQDMGRYSWQFRDLQILAECDSDVDVYVFETKYDKARGWWEAEVLFAPPLAGEKMIHPVNIQGRWPNLWETLRRSGSDRGEFYLAEPASDLELSVVFPKKWQDLVLGLKPTEFLPAHNTTPPEDFKPELLAPEEDWTVDGRKPRYTWRIKNAQPGWYRYEVFARRNTPASETTL